MEGVTVLGAELGTAWCLDSVRSLVNQRVVQQPLPTPGGVHLALTVALRVAALTCQSIDSILAQGEALRTGAFQDSAIYRPCRKATEHLPRLEDGGGFWDPAADMETATKYLLRQGAFDDYATVVTGLVKVSSFSDESDDLVIHRCLLASHAFAEVYMMALQDELAAVQQPQRSGARYPKGDVAEAVVRTARGPILGHHQILTLNCAVCSDADMDPGLAFVSYRDNLCWLLDWATAGRMDGNILAAVRSATAAAGGEAQSEAAATGPESESDPQSGPAGNGPWPWQARNGIGDEFSRWLARLDHVTKTSSNARLTHTGTLCDVDASMRKVLVASICYGSFHFWPTPRLMSAGDYAEHVCACMGEMSRSWAIDHDTEASIGEHNLLNWLCRACAAAATRETLSPANARAARGDGAMRVAWGPQTYFYFGHRHCGFARRVDNLGERPVGPVPVRLVPPSCTPIAAGDGVAEAAAKLLALCGAKPVRAVDLGEPDWPCRPRICRRCAFDGDRAQLFMVSVGAARLAAGLPDACRPRLVRLVDTYGFRLFPALQARLLVQCPCLPRWVADVMSHGYAEAGLRCGQSDCSVTADSPRGTADPCMHGDESESVREALLRQAHAEAAVYADKTGQRRWLDVVSQPLDRVPERVTRTSCSDADTAASHPVKSGMCRP